MRPRHKFRLFATLPLLAVLMAISVVITSPGLHPAYDKPTMIMTIAVMASMIVTLCFWLWPIGRNHLHHVIQKQRVLCDKQSREDERLHLARELHDGIGQSLVAVKLQLETAMAMVRTQPEVAGTLLSILDKTTLQVRQTLEDIRRISHGMVPAMLEDTAVETALHRLLVEWGECTGIAVSFHCPASPFVLDDTQKNITLFRVAQEALHNIVRHANASHVNLSLVTSGNDVSLTMHDNGTGFDVRQASHYLSPGMGLRNARERLAACNGKLALSSNNNGTTITVTIAY